MKKIKFPLILKDEVPVRTIEELRENFDLNKITNYFLNGKLLAWLEARYYEKEANAVKEWKKDEDQLHQKLCSIFGVEYSKQDVPVNMEEVEERNLRLARLRQYTSDENILSQVDHVAFDQEELSNLLDENVHDIYLCSNSFSIPLKFENRKYIGIGKVEAVINSSERIDFSSIGIEFENIQFDAEYEKLRQETPEDLYLLGLSAEEKKDYISALEYYRKAADQGTVEAFYKIGRFYYNGLGVEQNYHEAYIWYKKSADLGHAGSMHSLGVMYFNGEGVSKNYMMGQEWYKKAIEKGYAYTMYWRGRNHLYGTNGYIKSISEGIRWLNQSAERGCTEAMRFLGDNYGNTCSIIGHNISKSIEWFRCAAKDGDAESMWRLSLISELDNQERMTWLEKSAEAGYIPAIFSLASDYYNGYFGFEQNHEKVLSLCKKAIAIDENNSMTQNRLPGLITSIYYARPDLKEAIEKNFSQYINYGATYISV